MAEVFAEQLKRLRRERRLSQQKLADMLFVDRSSVASWETGRRLPDAAMLTRIAECFGTDAGALLRAAASESQRPNVIMVDDERIILNGGLSVLAQALPEAEITGFLRPSEALAYARENRVDLAFLDIELGQVSGLDLCRELLAIRPDTNVIFLTAFADYSFRAWDTGACGFLLKPLIASSVEKALSLLRHPLPGGGGKAAP